MIKVIYPGTFDPITNGHLDIIERSAKLFPHVIVAVATNPSKKPLLELPVRVQLVQEAVAHLPHVEVIGFSELLANIVKEKQIQAIIRGVRTTIDFEYERQLAQLNKMLADGVETLFFPPDEKWSAVSSTVVREIYLHKGDITTLVPANVMTALNQRN